MAIEREANYLKSIRDASTSDKRKENRSSSSNSGKKQRSSAPRGFQRQGRGYQG